MLISHFELEGLVRRMSCKLAAGGVLPGNADDVAVPGEHEAEGEDEAKRGMEEESENGDVSPLRRTGEDCSTSSKIEG